MLVGRVETVPRVSLVTDNPVIQEVDPQFAMIANFLQMMNTAMDKRDERLMKMSEDRDAGNRRPEAVADNTLMGSGGTGNPSEFSGATNPVACMKWFQEIELAFKSSECRETQKVRFAL
ncbi:hypothetical protein L6452_40287 [Arctium lappa]|uniref:Uncharacterized protein n=1 Tax=Arctium lappa TaxID=4217 RepID=A0ACB8XMC0_ARCLA|nr:hypothetical protein L6452_40287 [Arctium lappa]